MEHQYCSLNHKYIVEIGGFGVAFERDVGTLDESCLVYRCYVALTSCTMQLVNACFSVGCYPFSSNNLKE